MKLKTERTQRRKKTMVIIGSVVAALVIIFGLGAYITANGYLSKIKFTSGKHDIASSIDDDPEDPAATDSPQQDIDAYNKEVEQNLQDNSTPLLYDKDVFNILFIGGDSRASGGSGRSDSMILISINKKNKRIIATSIMRDIYLQIPGVAKGNRINAAYAYGGADLLLKTVQQNFKVKVDKYIAVDFFSFIDIIDKVGGVSIDISDAEIKVANRYINEINRLEGLSSDDGIITQPGEQNLTGKQALGYARIRYVGNADFQRTDRQRTILARIFSKVKTQNAAQLNDLLNAFLPKITTNLGKGELFSLIINMPNYKNYATESCRVPVNGSYSFMTIRKMSILKVDFEKNIEDMKKRIYE